MGLLGHNGAGKSTLIKVLSGVYPPDQGEIRVAGQPVRIESTRDAKALGIETIYQNLALAENLDAVANLFLGRERYTRFGFLDEEAMEHETRRMLDRMKLRLPSLRNEVSRLSGGQRQAIAIGRAVYFDAKILIMDEPTAALGPEETAKVGELIRELKTPGHRHLPDQPRHPRRLRSRRPPHRAEPWPGRRHGADRATSPRTTCCR